MGEVRTYMIGADAISAWVATLLKRAQVIAPRTLHGLDEAYDVVESADQVAWDYSSSISPLKRHLFPQTDPLFYWHRQAGNGLDLKPIYDEAERVFLAIRPCDLSAVLFLDKVFSRDHPDTYYLARRHHSTLVTLACTEPGEHCFCVCAHAGPFLDGGYDVQLTPLQGEYLVEVGTDKGWELVRPAESLFSPAPIEAVQMRRELARQAEQRFSDDRAYFAAGLRKITFDRVPDELWEQMGDRCLSCGACTDLAPKKWTPD